MNQDHAKRMSRRSSDRTRLMLVACVLLTTVNSGCQLLNRFGQAATTPTPVAFQSSPSLDAVLQAVNRNSGQVQTLQTEGARLSMRTSPAVTAELVIERPKRIRFKAGTSITGSVVDLGSNDELFWFWSPLDRNPALYFARHEEFARSTAAQTMPIEPQWLIDAIGLVDFDPSARHEGPYNRGRDTLEIRSYYPTATGQVVKVTQVHNRFAWVLGQQIYDARGQLVATTKASNHQYFPLQQVALPRRIQFDLSSQLQFEIDATDYRINQPLGNPELLFALPTDDIPNTPVVNLLDPQGIRGNTASPSERPPEANPVGGSLRDNEYPRGSAYQRGPSSLSPAGPRVSPNEESYPRYHPTDADRQWSTSTDSAQLPRRGLEPRPWR